ncbi:hypothetical protein CFI10_17085 [Marinobacterium iners]|nr:hypothetical protein CFI10_17085 [Marinobacterium iners]
MNNERMSIQMQLSWQHEFHGPNPFTTEPVVVAVLDLESARTPLTWAAAAEFTRRFTAWVDGTTSESNGQADACDSVAILQAVIQWSLGVLNDVRGDLQAGGVRRDLSGRLCCWLGFHEPQLSRAVFERGLRTLTAVQNGSLDMQALNARLADLEQACRRHHPDYQARILRVAARAHNIPVLPFVPGSRFWQFGWGKHSRVFFESFSNDDAALGSRWQSDKPLSKQIFQSLGLPTPRFERVNDTAQLHEAAQRIGYPCVVKPVSCGGGKGVTAAITDQAGLEAAYSHARRFAPTGPLMIESHQPGDDYRLVLVSGQLVAAIRRRPACVTGDGHSTVTELVDELNRTRSANLVKSRYLRPIMKDHYLVAHLAAQGMTLDTCLPAGQRLSLRSNANLSTGGSCDDYTDQVHPQLKAMAEQVAQTFGIATAGLDYITTDISAPPAMGVGAFIEINTTPGLDACVAAGWSESRIGHMVLGDIPQRIALTLHVVTEDRLGAEREQLKHTPLPAGEALACGDLLRVGEALFACEPAEPWPAVRAALRNKSVTSLVVMCTAREIMQQGLPVDKVDRVEYLGVTLTPEWMQVLSAATPTA